MFDKHEYTCPDVIHIRERQKKNAITTTVVTVLGIVALNVWGWRMSKKIEDPIVESFEERHPE